MVEAAYDIDQLADSLISLFPVEAGEMAASEYTQYASDPVGFAERVLGESLTGDVMKLMESVRDNVITIARSANATGKTHAAARIATWFYKCHEECQVYTAAAPPEDNLRRLLWGEIGSVAMSHPEIFSDDEIKALNVQRNPLDFITGVTIPSSGTPAERVAKFSGKHRSNLMFILDEGDAIPDEVYQGIESCMSGGTIVRLLIMFNPRAERGEVYRKERDGKAAVVELSAFNHPNVVTGENRIPGAVTREVTVRRINEWCRPLAPGEDTDRECFRLPDFLVGATATSQAGKEYAPLVPGTYRIIEPVFSYMVLGRYPAQGSNQLISREWIEAARNRWDQYTRMYGEKPEGATRGRMGLDAAEFGTDANAACRRYGGFVPRFETWGGVDMIETGERAAAYYLRFGNLELCNVDATGVGAGVAPHMRRLGCAAQSIKVASSPTKTSEMGEFYRLRDQIWWSCREWLRTDPSAMLPPDEMLTEELQTPTYEIVGGKIKIMDKPTMRELLQRSPDRADALCLTFADAEIINTDDFVDDYQDQFDEIDEDTGY